MDIQLTEEQDIVRSKHQRFLREQYDFDERRKIVATNEACNCKHWKSFAELGLCAAPFQESSGGLGGGSLATMIVMQEFGRSLVVEPYFETVVLAGGLIEDCPPHPSSARSSCPRSWRERPYGRWPGRKDGRVIISTRTTTTARRQGDKFVRAVPKLRWSVRRGPIS